MVFELHHRDGVMTRPRIVNRLKQTTPTQTTICEQSPYQPHIQIFTLLFVN